MNGPDDAPPPLLVDTPEGLARLVARLEGEPRIALDTEADSLHAFREQVCVVQISAPGLDAILDPLAIRDLSPLRALADRADGLLVMHGGDYDISILSRDHGFRFHDVFDTMIAATLLGEPRVGLAALVESAYGVLLSKKHQTADWRRRPFTPELVRYLRGDTAYLLGLHERLDARLREVDLAEEARIEFRRLATRQGAPWRDDPEAWRGLKGAEKLDARGRAVLVAAFAWREGRARTHDVPRFKVIANEALLELATRPPTDLEGLERTPGTRGVIRAGDGPSLLEAVLEGVAAFDRGEAPPAPARPRRTSEEAARADVLRRREERLRRWRTEEALRRGVPNVVVLPNPGMMAMVEAPPADVEAIAALQDVGPKRAARYGATYLALLAEPVPTAQTDATKSGPGRESTEQDDSGQAGT